MRPRLNTASARDERLGQHRRGLGRGQVALGDDGHEGRARRPAAAARARRTPSTDGRRDEPAEHAGGRVLGVPVVGGRHGEGVVGAGGGGRRGGEGGRGAQAPGDGDLRAHRDREAVVPEHLGRHPCGQVRRVVEEARPLRPRCARAASRPARPPRSRSGRGRRPGCRTRVRGWPTRRGPGRARRQATCRSEDALEQRPRGDVAGRAAPARRRAGCRGSPRRCRRARPGAPGRSGRAAGGSTRAR